MFSFWSSAKAPPPQDGRPPTSAATTVTTVVAAPTPEPIAISHTSSQMTTTTTIPTQAQSRGVLDPRSLKQLGFFFAGASFFALSTLITRRAVKRRHAATIPKFYSRSNQTAISSAPGEGSAAAQAAAAAEGKAGGSGPLIAVEALNLATLNVLSFAVMLTGGVTWALDVSSLDDLRAYAGRHIDPPGGRTEEEAEREVEEWMARVLARTGARGGGGAGEGER